VKLLGNKIDEDKLLAILYANFRGKKKKIDDWIYLANIVDELSKFYGSYKKLSSHLGISPELLRETLKLLELPKEVQQLVQDGSLKHEVAWRIASVKGINNQVMIAKKLVNMGTHDARNLLRLFRENPSIDVDELLNVIDKSKNSVSQYSLVLVPIKKVDYIIIKREARKKNVNPSKLLSDIIIPLWIERGMK